MSRVDGPKVYRALSGQIKHETGKAVLFQIHAPSHADNNKQIWFPLSQLASVHRCYDESDGNFDVLMVSEWILSTKGLLSAATEKNPALEILAKREQEEAKSKENFQKILADTRAKTAAKKAHEKLVASRLPYKDDEGPEFPDYDGE